MGRRLTGHFNMIRLSATQSIFQATKRNVLPLWLGVACSAILALGLTGSSVLPASAERAAQTSKAKQIVNNQVIMKLLAAAPDESFLQRHALLDARRLHRGPSAKLTRGGRVRGLDRLYVARTQGELRKTLKALNADPLVAYAEPDYEVRISVVPNDPSFSNLWGLHNTSQTGGTADADIDAPEAWDSATGTTVTVGIIDTGVDYTHEDLAANMWQNPGEIPGNGLDDDGNGYVDDVYGHDFVNNDSDPFDDQGHGTHVAGTIGAVGNNGLGVTGVNWTASIAALKFLSASGGGSTSDAVEAVLYANMMGFRITNNSWGGGGYSQALYDAIDAADADGNIFIAAAGNSGVDTDLFLHYPSSYDLPNIISVAATNHTDALASFSNYGATTVDLGAPGVSIYSTVPTGSCSLCSGTGYSFLNGTSMATPHVAGTAALIMGHDPLLSHGEVKDLLLLLGDPIPSLTGKTVSGKRLNLYNFLDDDSIPPDTVTDLGVTSATHSTMSLLWTAVGDDGLVGQAATYDLRYSTSPIDEASFDSATSAITPVPGPSGSTETATITGLSHSTLYYVALKVLDNVGNSSGLSNVASATTTLATVVFSDDMEGVKLFNWSVSGSDGVGGPALWHKSMRRATSPVTAWYYGLESSGTYNTGATNRGTLTSPLINLGNLTEAVLVFSQFLQTENAPTNTAPFYDSAVVEASSDGGVTWTSLEPSYTSTIVWQNRTVDLSTYDGQFIQIRFRIDTIDELYNDFEGWYIDDVEIYGTAVNPNTPPVADVGGPYAGTEDVPITFDGSASYDPDGDPLTYSWCFDCAVVSLSPQSNGLIISGSEELLSGPIFSHTFTTGGLHSVLLVVNDGSLSSLVSSTSVTVTEVNDPPVADAGPDQIGTLLGTFTFNGLGSSDEEVSITSYSWDFGDGTGTSDTTSVPPPPLPPDNSIVTHQYAAPGTYTTTLTVTDSGGLTASDTTVVTVTADVVVIFSATYKSKDGRLVVQAESSDSPDAVLTVEGYGIMTYNSRRDRYRLIVTGTANPSTVTVTSSYGGSTTVAVSSSGGGGGGGRR